MQIPRLAPREPPYSPAVAAELARVMPEGVPPLLLFKTLALNERVLLRVFAGGLLDRGALTLREREIVILRTCARCGSEYEWGVHAAFFGAKAKLAPAEIAATAGPVEASPLSPREQLLLRLVDALHDTSGIDGPLYAELAGAYGPEQLVELVALAGFYHLISFVTNAFALPPEPWAPAFPGLTGSTRGCTSPRWP